MEKTIKFTNDTGLDASAITIDFEATHTQIEKVTPPTGLKFSVIIEDGSILTKFTNRRVHDNETIKVLIRFSGEPINITGQSWETVLHPD